MNENWPEIVEDLSPCLRPGAIKGDYLRDVGYCLRYLGWKKDQRDNGVPGHVAFRWG